jgi:hypothetical protein
VVRLPVTRRLERLGIRPLRETISQGRVVGRFYVIPLSWLRWGLKRAGAGAQIRRLAVQTAL